MAWQTVVIEKEQFGRNTPSVSIGHKRLSMSISACDLIDLKRENYQYVQFMTDDKNPNIVGMRFWKKNANPNCIPLKQKYVNGKSVGGVDVVNANLMKYLFGDIADNDTVTKFRVRRDDDPYVLIIDLKE